MDSVKPKFFYTVRKSPDYGVDTRERIKRGRPRKTWMEGVRAAMKTRYLEADQWLNRKE
jgi:hypothetical protein